MLCSRFLKPPQEAGHGWFFNATERMFDAWRRLYDVTLRQSLRFHALTMAVSIVLIGATAYLFTLIPKGFLPNEDVGRINVTTEAIQGVGFDDMVRKQQQVSAIISRNASIAGVSTFVNSNRGNANIDLKPRDDRNQTAQDVIASLRPLVTQVPGMRVFMNMPQPINLGGQQGARSPYQFTLHDTDTDELYHWAPLLEEKIRQIPGLEDVSSDLQVKNPQIRVEMNRDRISALGLTVNQVETALNNAYGTRQVSQIYAPNNQYQVVMQVAPEFQRDPAALSMLYVRASGGRLIPLDTLARVYTDVGPLTVAHTGQLPSVTISFNLKPGVALGDAVSAIQTTAASLLPSTVTTSFQGAAQAFQDSLRGLGLILAMAIVVIYIVLGVLYESFTHPLTILSGLPAAGFGALLTLLLFKAELSLYAFVGIIMLIGLVKKNGIMMVDFAVAAQRERGLTPRDAIHEACLVRFRPIMMTTMAALVGTLPIALGLGAGAESRRPLGLAVVGGLIVSQLLTLYITPVYYVYIENARMWLTRRRPRPVRASVEEPGRAPAVAMETVVRSS
jgi:HAE1 family hydrophobic/amphiphilic exporter-1